MKQSTPALEAAIEVDYPAATPQEIHRTLMAYGCCILRNGFPADEVLRYRDMVDKVYAPFAARLNAGEQLSDWDRGHLRDDQITAEFGRQNSFFRLLETPKYQALLDSIFGASRHQPAVSDSVTRSVQLLPSEKAEELDSNSLTPSPVHIDGLYHDTWPFFAVNFWIPFSSCGKGTDSPGFIVYPSDYRDVRHYLDLLTPDDMKRHREMEAEKLRTTESIQLPLEKLFKDKAIEPVTPRFEIGDAMLITSWVPHGTYHEKNMHKHRRNVELRFRGDSWDPALRKK